MTRGLVVVFGDRAHPGRIASWRPAVTGAYNPPHPVTNRQMAVARSAASIVEAGGFAAAGSEVRKRFINLVREFVDLTEAQLADYLPGVRITMSDLGRSTAYLVNPPLNIFSGEFSEDIERVHHFLPSDMEDPNLAMVLGRNVVTCLEVMNSLSIELREMGLPGLREIEQMSPEDLEIDEVEPDFA